MANTVHHWINEGVWLTLYITGLMRGVANITRQRMVMESLMVILSPCVHTYVFCMRKPATHHAHIRLAQRSFHAGNSDCVHTDLPHDVQYDTRYGQESTCI